MNHSEIVEGLPVTTLEYQEDPHSAKTEGSVIRVANDQSAPCYLVLVSTIFHPKGGRRLLNYPYTRGYHGHLSGQEVEPKWGPSGKPLPEHKDAIGGRQ